MKHTFLSIVALITLAIVFYPQKELISKINGSPGGKTGSPADGGSCIQCHDDFALNSGVGIPNITSNIPSTGYVPGVTYTITSSIAEAGLVRFGFEVTAEDGLNNKVGTFFITNTTETKFANGTSNTAVTHKQAGTSGINIKSWDCDWEAPVSGTGPVTFYSACNAANDDGDDDDDYIYTTNTAYQESVVLLYGCTDSLACNYDSLANTNDGSCNYNSSSYDTLSVTASIVWNGIPLNASGDYSVILTNSVGCDSIVNLNLTITNPSGILNITNTEKILLKITDMLGQETPYRRNTPLFYIYDDGTVEKRIIME